MSAFFRILQLLLLLSAAASIPAYAETLFSRPLHIIVPYAAGGGVDAVIRPIANAVSAKLGQPVVVENRPGGNTFIGMNACAKAPADGYTLCVTNADSLSFGPFVFKKIPYDPAKDLVGVTKLASAYAGLFISGQSSFKSFQEVIAYARANPGKLNFGSFGTGTVSHLYVETFRRQLNADMTHVVYKGASPIIPALISNEVQIAWLALAQVLPHIKAGKIKAIAIDYSARYPELPDVPTLTELNASAGIQTYFGLYAPAATPAPVLDRLNAAFTTALRDPKVQESMSGLLFMTTPTTVADFNRARRDEADNARRVTQAIGLKPLDMPE